MSSTTTHQKNSWRRWVPDTLPISHSELKTWVSCRRRWMLAYYKTLQPKHDMPTGVAHIGGNIHLALEGYYGYGLDALQVLRWAYAELIEQHPDDEPALRKDLDMASAMVEGYLQWVSENGIDVGLSTVATEHEVTYQVILPDSTPVTWRAKLDVLMRRESDGRVLLRDFKTVGGFEKANTLILDTQMRFYAMMQSLANPNPASRVDGAQYLMIKRSKRTARATGPFYELAEVSYNKADLRSTYLRSLAISQEIVMARRRLDAGENPLYVCFPTPAEFCSWGCQYQEACPMFDAGDRVEAKLAAEYTTQDAYLYYGTARIERAVAALSG
jgi:hypothetical protein